MATTSLWHIEGRLKDLIDYVETPEKMASKTPELQDLYNVFSYVQRPEATQESEYVTAARALGASGGRIIKKHLLTNCMGTLIVTTTLQIPSSIVTESYLSFLGLGVAAPMPSLGSLATDAVKGMNTYPVLLIAPALMISIMILVFNLFGDGLRDAFDPKLKS